MRIEKLSYALFILVFGILGLTVAKRDRSPTIAGANAFSKQHQERKHRFPTADYDEPESTDVKKNAARKEKKLRKNNFKLVARNPPSWQAERVAINEGGMEFPALPIDQSAFIVLGTVTASEAHVSENKKNVYSEFTVAVEKVLKTANSSVSEGTQITVDRIGGFVKYPSGQSVLYRISGMNMPLIGERYLFFLNSSNQLDVSILTAYELGAAGVTPLDESSQFEKYRGVTEARILQSVLDSLAKSSPF